MIDKKNFMGGMNQDDSDRVIPQNDYRFALNISNSEKENTDNGEVVNVKGVNEPVFLANLPNGINKVIGSWEDELNGIVYYFVHNDNQLHSIFILNTIANEVDKLITNSFLNFNVSKTINHINRIDKYLMWVDAVGSPKKLDIEKAKNGDYDNYTDDYFLEMYSKPPMIPIFAQSKTDFTQKSNNVKGNLWQWQYRWIYYDNTKSTFSPISKIYAPTNEYVGNQFADVPYYFNNYYELAFETGDIEVEYVEITARIGNLQDFRSVATIDVKAQTNQVATYNFYNDAQSLIVPKIESDLYYSYVPLTASSLEVVQPNRIVLGDYVEGYDNINLSASLEFLEEEETSSKIAVIGTGFYANTKLMRMRSGNNSDYNDYDENFGSYTELASKGFSKDFTKVFNPPFEKFDFIDNPTGYERLFCIGWKTGDNTRFIHEQMAEWQEQKFAISDVENLEKNVVFVFGTRFQIGGKFNASNNTVDNPIEDVTDAEDGNAWIIADETTEDFKTFDLSGTALYEVGDTKDSVALRMFLSLKEKMEEAYFNYFELVETNGQYDLTYRIKHGESLYCLNYNKTKNRNTSRFGIKTKQGTPCGHRVRLRVEFGVDACVKLENRTMSMPEYSSVNNPNRSQWDNFGWFDVSTCANRQKNYGVGSYTTYNPVLTTYAYQVDEDYSTRNVLKRGSRHQVGVIYFDEAGRSSLVQSDSDLAFYLPTKMENNADIETYLKIISKPPIWAKYWQIAYTGNLHYQKFIQCNIDRFLTDGENAWSCVLRPLKIYQDEAGTILTYEYSEGDRIRFISPNNEANQDYYDDVYESIIIKGEDYVDPDDDEYVGYKILFRPIKGFPIEETEEYPLVELYTPKKKITEDDNVEESNDLFYEVGIAHRVYEPETSERRHFQDPNEDTILLTCGDVYRRLRVDVQSEMIGFVEDMNFTDFVRSPFWDKGRVNYLDPSFRQVRRTNSIIYSGVFTTNTKVNEINLFLPANFMQYETIYGNIRKLFYKDGRLLVLMTNKVGQVQVNKNVLFDSSSQIIGLAGQENVLSNITYYVGDYGIGDYIESFVSFENVCYFYDNIHNEPIELASNGITKIDYKMNSWFKNYVEIKPPTDRSSYFIKSAFNRDNKEMVVAFFLKAPNDADWKGNLNVENRLAYAVDLNAPLILRENAIPIFFEDKVLAFSTVKRRWVSFYSYTPDWIDSSFDDIISFTANKVFIHNNIDQRNLLYKTSPFLITTIDTAESIVDVVFNAQSDNTKVFKNIGVKGNQLWYSELSATNEGQETNNIESDFREREGEYYAHLLRDVNSDGGIIEGDSMRSYSMTTRFKNKSNLLSRLWSVSCEFFISHFTK